MPESLTRRESAYVNLWGVRLHVGMASGFSSERCPASPRNRVRLQVGIASGIASEYLAGISRNLHRILVGLVPVPRIIPGVTDQRYAQRCRTVSPDHQRRTLL